jgi:altronate dehydratase
VDLLQIAKLASAENAAIVLHPSDQVAIARVSLQPGQKVWDVTVLEAVPAGHKVAIADVPDGGWVRRYGQNIGRAHGSIKAGSHVHTHNVAYEDYAADYVFPTGTAEPAALSQNVPTRGRTGGPARATTSPWWPPATAPPIRRS